MVKRGSKFLAPGIFGPQKWLKIPISHLTEAIQANIVLKEGDIKNVFGYNFFQLPF